MVVEAGPEDVSLAREAYRLNPEHLHIQARRVQPWGLFWPCCDTVIPRAVLWLTTFGVEALHSLRTRRLFV